MHAPVRKERYMKTHNTDKIIEQILEQLKKCTDPDLLDLILKLLL
jgi:metal-sulfur cluster biosynthetic enzyme